MSTNGNTVLTINGLSKSYKKLRAVNKLNLNIEKEMIFGLLGPNGSGKTTTLGMLLGVTQPSEGSFSWFGNGDKNENRKRIGALLETPNFYPYLTAQQNLELVAKIKGLENPASMIEDVLKQVDLYDRRDSNFKTFSLGMKQRLAIASAMLGDPEVLVLDEPTNGLDPQGIAEIRELITRIGKQGKTIIIASHILDEVEKVCTHCAIMRKGELLRIGTIGELIGNQNVTLIRVGSDQMTEMKQIIESNEGFEIYKEDGNELIISVTKGTPAADINKFFFERGVVLNHLNVFNESLENQFLEIVNES